MAKRTTFVIDCSDPVEEDEHLIDTGMFASYLGERIKVDNKRGNLGDNVKISNDKTSVSVNAAMPFSKRQLKYLAKKFLKKEGLRDFLHVLATNPSTYKLAFFQVQEKDDE